MSLRSSTLVSLQTFSKFYAFNLLRETAATFSEDTFGHDRLRTAFDSVLQSERGPGLFKLKLFDSGAATRVVSNARLIEQLLLTTSTLGAHYEQTVCKLLVTSPSRTPASQPDMYVLQLSDWDDKTEPLADRFWRKFTDGLQVPALPVASHSNELLLEDAIVKFFPLAEFESTTQRDTEEGWQRAQLRVQTKYDNRAERRQRENAFYEFAASDPRLVAALRAVTLSFR